MSQWQKSEKDFWNSEYVNQKMSKFMEIQEVYCACFWSWFLNNSKIHMFSLLILNGVEFWVYLKHFLCCLLLGWSCYVSRILQTRVLIIFFYYFWHLFCSISWPIYAFLAQTGGKKKEDLDSWFSDESQMFNMYANHSSIVKVRPILLLIVIWLLTQVSSLYKLIVHVTHQVICCYTGVCWLVIT